MKSKKLIVTLFILVGTIYTTIAQDIIPDSKLLYKEINGDSLYLHLFKPAISKKPTAVIVFFFGGGWTGGNPKQFYQQSKYLATRGILAISAEYRIKSKHGTTPFDCVEDGKSAIRWVRKHAKELNINPNKIVAAGGSAGGHVAISTALIKGLDNPNEKACISSVPNAIIGYNPVLDTTKKGYGAGKVVGRETEISPCHHVTKGLPPTLIFHGKADKTVPFENASRFHSLMIAAGNDTKLVAVDNADHGFFNGSFFRKKSNNKYFNLTMHDTELFLEKLGYLSEEPTTTTFNKSTIKFKYSEITGIGYDAKYNRRDNSDVIKVDDTYYVWYTRMNSPTTSGYWGTIWYATSKDEGHTWQEQGMALDLGKKGTFDSHSVFTPNILVHQGKYYMYYTGVKPTPGNVKNEFENNATNDITAIGLAVADSPKGPFIRTKNNPVLTISNQAKDFDSYRIDDASMLVKDHKIWLYYKGRSKAHGNKGAHFTQMGVAYAKHPEGPFVKNNTPILDKSHEVLIWETQSGIASLASINQSINFATDGIHFKTLHTHLEKIPKAPGLYRPSLTNRNSTDASSNWGIAMIQKKKQAYLIRFEIIQE